MSFLRLFASASDIRRILLLSIVFLCAVPLSAFAKTEYVPLVGIPGIPTTGGGDLTAYFNRLYLITISIGAIIAVVKIFMAGIKWSMSDIITDKSSAKTDIRGALLGLAILLIPFIVLNEIYPGLTNLNFLKNAESLKIDLTVPLPTGTRAGTTGGTQAGEYGTPIDYGGEPITYSQSEFDSLTPMDFAMLEANCSPKNLVISASGGTSRTVSCGTPTSNQTPSGSTGAEGSGEYGAPIDYEANTVTISQDEFNTYTETDIFSWYGRCGGEDKLRIARSNNTVTLSCAGTNP